VSGDVAAAWGVLGGGAPLLWAAIAALAAVLTVDDTGYAQTWLSLPLPSGLLAGALAGDAGTGLVVGTLFQLVTLGNLPVGRSLSVDPVPAVVGTTGGAILAGAAVGDPWRGDGAALGAWLLLFCCVASLLGQVALRAERRSRWRWVRLGARSLLDGGTRRIARIQLVSLLITGLRGAGMALLWMVLVQAVWLPLQARLPAEAWRALALVPLLAPWLAIGTILDRFGSRAAIPPMVFWAVAGFLALRYLG